MYSLRRYHFHCDVCWVWGGIVFRMHHDCSTLACSMGFLGPKGDQVHVSVTFLISMFLNLDVMSHCSLLNAICPKKTYLMPFLMLSGCLLVMSATILENDATIPNCMRLFCFSFVHCLRIIFPALSSFTLLRVTLSAKHDSPWVTPC
jgi:hypothetical protein